MINTFCVRVPFFFYIASDHAGQGKETLPRDGRERQETLRYRDAKLHPAEG